MDSNVNHEEESKLKPLESTPMDSGSLVGFEDPSAASPRVTPHERGALVLRCDAAPEIADMAMTHPHHRKAQIARSAGNVALADAPVERESEQGMLSEMKASFVSGYRDGYRGWRRNLRNRIRPTSSRSGR